MISPFLQTSKPPKIMLTGISAALRAQQQCLLRLYQGYVEDGRLSVLLEFDDTGTDYHAFCTQLRQIVEPYKSSYPHNIIYLVAIET